MKTVKELAKQMLETAEKAEKAYRDFEEVESSRPLGGPVAPLTEAMNTLEYAYKDLADICDSRNVIRLVEAYMDLNTSLHHSIEEYGLLNAWTDELEEDNHNYRLVQDRLWKERDRYRQALERLDSAVLDWLTFLEDRGGHYYDGIPGELMDAAEEARRALDPEESE